MSGIGPLTGIQLIPTPTVSGNFLGDADRAVERADELTARTIAATDKLIAVVGTLTAPMIDVDLPPIDVPPALEMPAAPAFQTVVWSAPELPVAFSGTVDVEGLMPAPFDELGPTLNFAAAPAPFADVAPSAPGVDLSYVDPTLSVSLPAAPDLLQISVTPFSGLNMPTFSAVEPTLSVVAPSIREYTPGAQYTSGLLTAVQASLLQRISGGGTGLGQQAETAIWERGKEREARSARDALDKIDQMAEGLGYNLPPGVFVDARLRVITETDYAERGHSREVMIESARLELENVKHALTTATSLEGSLISYANQVEQRLFDSVRYATESGIAIYNAQVEAYGRMVEVYRTKVQVYEAQIRAETARVDAYRVQIEAERMKADVNTALVNQYRVQADIALSAIEIYKAQIAGIQAKADIERAKVEIFGEQVRAYSARVNAYTAGVEGFRASIEAERTKQQAFQSRVDAFSAQVNAGAKQIDARIAVLNSQIATKTVEWDGYKATVAGETARVNGLVEGNKALADIYRASVAGQSSFNDTLTKQWEASIERTARSSEIAVSVAKANSDLFISTRALTADAVKMSATVFSQLGAAALNSLNWSNSISESMSSVSSSSYSSSISDSNSYGFSESHNFNYNP